MIWLMTFMMGLLLLFLATPPAQAALSGSLEESAILLRIQGESQVNIRQDSQNVGLVASTPTATLSPAAIGQHRYEETCHVCHGPGLAGAPKFQDASDWAPRIAEGIEILVQHAIQGYKAMPAKGTCMNCSDAEIKQAVEYMISQSK